MAQFRIEIDSIAFNAALAGSLGPVHFTDPNVKIANPLSQLEFFEKKFPKEMQLFKAVGIHPTDPAPVINPYTKELATESYRNIGEHSIAVGYCAYKIAEALTKAGHIDEEIRDWITSRALVHDLTKPYEIMRRDAHKAGITSDLYSVSAYQNLAPLLINLGVPENTAAYLVNAGKETGHNSLRDFIRVNAEGYDGIIADSLAEKIVHLADDMTFTNNPTANAPTLTAYLTCWERMLAARFLERYPFLWQEGLVVDENGAVESVKNLAEPGDNKKLIGSYAALQVRVANDIALEIQRLLDPTSRIPAENFIRYLVNSD